jgi:hypothetical protein
MDKAAEAVLFEFEKRADEEFERMNRMDSEEFYHDLDDFLPSPSPTLHRRA